jgi:hypothetical protein
VSATSSSARPESRCSTSTGAIGSSRATARQWRRSSGQPDAAAGRWRRFIYNAIGFGARSLALAPDNFLKPWLFVDVRRGRVTGFYFDLRYVD